MASSLNDSSPSDTDLSTGLPSPHVSDDEDFKQDEDLGIVVPKFCNKLRGFTQHLFPKSEAVMLSDLCEVGSVTVKNESKKKTALKDEVDPPRKPMVSHGGYHSSPRWDTKSPSLRSYDPCDITGGDELEVAGVLFRSWTDSRDKQFYSKSESDFPSLNESSLTERSEMSKSNDSSILGLSNLSLGNQRNKGMQSPSLMKTAQSPVTSTPHNKSKSISLQESPLPQYPESPLCGNQSFNKSESRSQSKSSSKSNRRRSKKLLIHNNPVDPGSKSPADTSPTVDINANNCLHPKISNDRLTQQGLDSDGNRRNPLFPSRKSKQQSGIIPNAVSIENRPASPSWNDIVKSSSPRLSPVLRVDSPRNCQNPAFKEEPKPIEITRKAEELRVLMSSDSSGQLGTPACSKKKSKGRVHRAQLMSVDSSSTEPKKNSDSETWSSKSNTAFENRFVEKIAVSSTSPPKKVNPSPIKKLDFSHRVSNTSSFSRAEKEGKAPAKSDSVFKRQMSLISDLNWKKSCSGDPSDTDNKGDVRANNKERNGRSKRAVFSLEDFVKTQKVTKIKDEICEAGELKGSESDKSRTKTDEFSINKSTGHTEEVKLTAHGSGNGIESSEVKARNVSTNVESTLNPSSPRDAAAHSYNSAMIADVKLVTLKPMLRAYAQRYCYYLEGHHVTNVSKELLFILQLLTCSKEDCLGSSHIGTNIFESIHNCVYFAVLVMKRLKSLFSCLPKQTVCLLATNQRVKTFSPKLHQFFRICLMPKETLGVEENTVTENVYESNIIGSSQNWSSTFSDVKMVHVFKCQRDNFFALYRRYQEADKDRPFPMEEQVHYVYNPQISEHKSVANLMHLAQLFMDLLLTSSVKYSNNQVNYLEMVVNSKPDSEHFQRQYEKWKTSNSALKLGSPPIWEKNEMFFKDFLKAIHCPAFTEILKNMIASKILELNNSDFECLKNLHSSACVPDDTTPQRCEKFTVTVYRLCILAKFLGFLVFDPYAGAEDLSSEESHYLIAVREMTPLSLPLPMILKIAHEKGHLSLTVPWIVQYLSMMDAGALKLTAYSRMINQLCSLHRHAWRNLFCSGYHNTGLLITCCISWLFENPLLSTIQLCSKLDDAPKDDGIFTPNETQTLDTQRLVTSHLLYSCCPYLNAGHIPLVLFALNHNTMQSVRDIVPLTSSSLPVPSCTIVPHQQANKDTEELCQWLGLSLRTQESNDNKSENNEVMTSNDEMTGIHEGQMVAPPVYSRFFTSTKYSLNELTTDFLKCHPYLSHCVHQSVDMMCGKVQDYTVNTLLKLAVFEARVKVRRKFMNMDAGEDANSLKSYIVANSNIMAGKLSLSTKQAFFQTGERVCQVELPNLIHFLASHMEESIRKTAVDIAQKAAMSRLLEWAKIQLGADVFSKVLINEAEKLASTWSFKSFSLYPSDYLRKPEYNAVSSAELSNSGFVHLQQLSKVLDTALACGSWYMNGQTRGPRPDDVFILGMMDDFMACIKDHSVGLDFSFSIMLNFIMHLIIQYIVDAPQNWTDSCLDTFINLCILFESKKDEDDRISFQPAESSHKAKNMKMKVTNFMSVYSLEWLSKSHAMDHSLMVYCRTLVKLIEASLVSVERTIDKLTEARVSHHLHTATTRMIDRIIVKVLELLLMRKSEPSGCSVEEVASSVRKTLENLAEWGSDKALTELRVVFGNSDNTTQVSD